jgi:hypothetical protein
VGERRHRLQVCGERNELRRQEILSFLIYEPGRRIDMGLTYAWSRASIFRGEPYSVPARTP